MDIRINQDEMKVLAYMHENATGYTEEFGMYPTEVAKALDVPLDEFRKAASYLAAHGLLGMKTYDAMHGKTSFPIQVRTVWLTGLGEGYMRELEEDPKIARKIGVKVVAEMGSVLKNVASKSAWRSHCGDGERIRVARHESRGLESVNEQKEL